MPLSRTEATGTPVLGGYTRGFANATDSNDDAFVHAATNGNGHLLNLMDNAAYDGQGEMPLRSHRGVAGVTTTVELGEFAPVARAPASTASATPTGPLCKPDTCRAMFPLQAASKPPAVRPNPWHRYKTVFLVATVAGLIIWAVAYLLLEFLEVL